MKVVVIDDQALGRELLKMYVANTDGYYVAGEADSLATGEAVLASAKPDIVLLDLQLGGHSGLDLLQKQEPRPFETIIVTGYKKYAYDAIRYNPVDYLLKPVDPQHLRKALCKARQNRLNQYEALPPFAEEPVFPFADRLPIPTEKGLRLIPVREIVYCRAQGNYTVFYLANDEKIMSSYTLKVFGGLLPRHGFFRVHKSYLVSMHHVNEFRKTDGGCLIMSNRHEVAISKRNKERFLAVLRGRRFSRYPQQY